MKGNNKKCCVACGERHAFEDCHKASVEHLLGRVEFLQRKAVSSFNDMGDKYGTSNKAVYVPSLIKYQKKRKRMI